MQSECTRTLQFVAPGLLDSTVIFATLRRTAMQLSLSLYVTTSKSANKLMLGWTGFAWYVYFMIPRREKTLRLLYSKRILPSDRKIDLFVKVRLTELDKEKFKYLKKLFTQFSQTFQFLNSLLRINLTVKNKIYIPLRNFKRANNKYLCISLLNQKFYFAKNSKTNLRKGIQIHKKKKIPKHQVSSSSLNFFFLDKILLSAIENGAYKPKSI